MTGYDFSAGDTAFDQMAQMNPEDFPENRAEGSDTDADAASDAPEGAAPEGAGPDGTMADMPEAGADAAAEGCVEQVVCPEGEICETGPEGGVICPDGVDCPTETVCPEEEPVCEETLICPDGDPCPVDGDGAGVCPVGEDCETVVTCPEGAPLPEDENLDCVEETVCPDGVTCETTGDGDTICPDGVDCETVTTCTPMAAESGGGFFDLAPVTQLVEAGGPVIIILGILSVIALAIILVKVVQFVGSGVWGRGFVARAVELSRAGKPREALRYLEGRKGPLARVVEAAVRGRTLGTGNEQTVREEVTRVAQAKLDGLEKGLTFLSLIATLSPLLGLLGTVLGMIEAFQSLQVAGENVDPSILSGGIWEALLTTAAGLAVAIPAAAAYTLLQRTVDATAEHMEDAATQIFTVDLYAQAATAGAGADEAPAGKNA